jgi:hypothetical protein
MHRQNGRDTLKKGEIELERERRAFFREFLPDNRVADNMIKEPLGDPLA